jgi:hypothetical protein
LLPAAVRKVTHPSPLGVKRRNTLKEHMFSAVASATDIAQQGQHVRSVPTGDILPLKFPFPESLLSESFGGLDVGGD